MNVHLPDDPEKFVEGSVQAGRYPGSSDVIQEAFAIVMAPELEKLLDEGMEDPDQAKTTEELRRGK